ncbi:glycine zipper domain-containing protein [Devosia sp. ZB163]|uniref:glycine zipper domain-containing protein n=1 Tax=Devosia sp. ZB163 TaxID=3025938 RepID=UPI00235F59EB|nr:glycine zipper domain-containing protein [Devosia sp. ZB163]MDC9824388.1 glycine zipper domain-containing protein [Devosia sp. ZB163]
MRKFLSVAVVLTATMTLAACTTTERTASAGAVTGAVLGGVTTGTVGGALAGAAIGGVTGAVAGQLLGRYRDDPTRCVYEDRYGRRYVDVC